MYSGLLYHDCLREATLALRQNKPPARERMGCSFSIRLAVTSHTSYVRSAGRKQRHFQTTSLL